MEKEVYASDLIVLHHKRATGHYVYVIHLGRTNYNGLYKSNATKQKFCQNENCGNFLTSKRVERDFENIKSKNFSTD